MVFTAASITNWTFWVATKKNGGFFFFVVAVVVSVLAEDWEHWRMIRLQERDWQDETELGNHGDTSRAGTRKPMPLGATTMTQPSNP